MNQGYGISLENLTLLKIFSESRARPVNPPLLKFINTRLDT